MSGRWARIERLFDAALELPVAERDAFLSQQCGDDAELRAEVAGMIEAHDGDRGLHIEARLLEASSPAVRGRAVGQYRLLEPIGHGGMGEVFLAERADAQYHQQVAVKLLRPGLYGAEMVSRFERERQILARLEHANIATLLDGGVADDGRPFLVMQYVDGEPITEYCDGRRLGIEARLRLFATACRAVQFSHANLVVHRDLKPSNILVTTDGELKLLDFGIAKLLDAEAGAAEATRIELRVLTPERAAPEQLLGEPVTAAVDVYALGLLLCELLADRLPYRFASREPQAIARIVDRQPPRPPSELLLRTVPEGEGAAAEPTVEELAERRGSRPERLRRQLAGELDHIALMALRREPERRYVSAAQLGEDVERYLAGEPVLAHAAGRTYRARKFLKRHRLAVAAAMLFTLVVLGFSIVTAIQSRSVAEQRDRANAERDRAEAVVQMLTWLFETADPVQDPGRDLIAVTELLERGEARIEDLGAQPSIRARMLLVLGQIHTERSRYDKARELLQRARAAYVQAGGATDPTSLTIDYQLARVAHAEGDYPWARQALADSLAAHRRFYGTRHARTAEVMSELALVLPFAERRPLLEEALAIRGAVLDPQDSAIAASLDRLATYQRTAGELESARRLYRQALEIVTASEGEKHPHTITVLSNLANTIEDPEERLAAVRRVLDLRREILPDSVDTAITWNNLGMAYLRAGRRAEALQAWDAGIELFTELLDEDHWQIGNTLRNQGVVLELEGRYPEALDHLERALALMRRAKGDNHLATGLIFSQHAQILARLGRPTEALHGARRGVEIIRRTTSTATPNLVNGLVCLGRVLLIAGSAAEAETTFREAQDLARSLFGPEDPRTARANAGFGQALAALGRGPEARRLLIDAEARLAEWPLADSLDLERLRAVLEDL